MTLTHGVGAIKTRSLVSAAFPAQTERQDRGARNQGEVDPDLGLLCRGAGAEDWAGL